MYCVKCGVKLQDGVEKCPLCGTLVWNPEKSSVEVKNGYSDLLPEKYKENSLPGVVAMTVLCAILIGVVLATCFKLYGTLSWGGFVIGGIALFYIVAVLPYWFARPRAVIFVPIDYAAVALYVLYIDLITGGRWFLSFAFPIIGICCLLTVALLCILTYIKHGRLFIFGGFLALLGGFTMLIEFFEHITFAAPMFRWSLYSVTGFTAAAAFLIVAGLIRPLRTALEKYFFF